MQDTDEVKARLPIEQVVGKYVPLKKAGRVFKGLCPFHNEKTPSFTVNPERGIYKCFGCGEGGDIFDFTMKLEGLSFPEALMLLAEQAGVELSAENSRPADPGAPRKDRLLALTAYAAKLWHTILTSHPKAEAARQYVASRGLLSETLAKFQIGLAPSGPVTIQSLAKQGFSEAEAKAAGDPARFQNRIVFPISDITGRPVGFTGRLFADAPATAPKYWNTPETPLFVKGRIVYALHLAKASIQERDLAILAEGQMDVVMLHQAGFTNAVASSGTALTADQLRLLARFSRNVAFAYDGDKAGIEATKRGLELALAEELNPSVITITGGKDPAEALQGSPELWDQAYEGRQPFMRWLLAQATDSASDLTPQRKKEVSAQLIPWLARVKSPVERRDWRRLVAAQLQIDEGDLESGPNTAPVKQTAAPSFLSSSLSADQRRGETALALLLAHPDTYAYVREQIAELDRLPSTPFLAGILPCLDLKRDSLTEAWSSADPPTQKQYLLQAEEVLKPYQNVELTAAEALTEILSLLQRLRSDGRETAKASMAERIKAAQASGDTDAVRALLEELKQLV